jgi:hypothetical protein
MGLLKFLFGERPDASGCYEAPLSQTIPDSWKNSSLPVPVERGDKLAELQAVDRARRAANEVKVSFDEADIGQIETGEDIMTPEQYRARGHLLAQALSDREAFFEPTRKVQTDSGRIYRPNDPVTRVVELAPDTDYGALMK